MSLWSQIVGSPTASLTICVAAGSHMSSSSKKVVQLNNNNIIRSAFPWTWVGGVVMIRCYCYCLSNICNGRPCLLLQGEDFLESFSADGTLRVELCNHNFIQPLTMEWEREEVLGVLFISSAPCAADPFNNNLGLIF